MIHVQVYFFNLGPSIFSFAPTIGIVIKNLIWNLYFLINLSRRSLRIYSAVPSGQILIVFIIEGLLVNPKCSNDVNNSVAHSPWPLQPTLSNRNLDWNEAMISIATIFQLASTSFSSVAISYGAGRHLFSVLRRLLCSLHNVIRRTIYSIL